MLTPASVKSLKTLQLSATEMVEVSGEKKTSRNEVKGTDHG